MTTSTYLMLRDPYGTTTNNTYPLFLMDYTRVEYVVVENDIGGLFLTLPSYYSEDVLRRDARLSIWRSVNGAPAYRVGEAVYFIRRAVQRLRDDGVWEWYVTAYDAKHLLDRRIVAYASGSSYAAKTAAADNLMKAIVRENLGNLATDTARTLSSSLFQVQADLSLAPTVDIYFSRRIVFETIRDIAQMSTQHDTTPTYLSFDVVAVTDDLLEFRTYTTARGVDRRLSNTINEPVLLGPAFGTMENIDIDEDFTSEVTYAYAGGQGEGDARVIQSASDTTRIGYSAYNRIERFQDARQNASSASVQDAANTRLRQGKPHTMITGKVRQSNAALFGVHYDFGDLVTLGIGSQMRDCRLSSVRVSIYNGQESIDIGLRSETDE
jgi:hypothetical protein